MNRDPNPVAPGDRLAPRTVPMARVWIEALTAMALRLLHDDLRGRENTAWIAPGHVFGEAVVEIADLERPSGERLPAIRLTISAMPSERPQQIATGFYSRGTSPPHLTLLLRSSLYVDEMREYLETDGQEQIANVLRHELTHALDPALVRLRHYISPHEDLVGYANQTVEQTAFAQQIVAEALDVAPSVLPIWQEEGHSLAFSVEALLGFSSAWRRFGVHFSPSSVQKMLRTLAASLDRRGLLAPFDARPGTLP